MTRTLDLEEFRQFVRYCGQHGTFRPIDSTLPELQQVALRKKREQILDAYHQFRFHVLPKLDNYFDLATGKTAAWDSNHTGPATLPPRLDPDDVTPFDDAAEERSCPNS